MGSCTTTFDRTTTSGIQLVRICTKYYCTWATRKVYIMKENSVAVNRAKRSVGDKPYALWGGGSATIVSPTEENNGDIILAELQCVPSVVGSRVMNINNVKVVDTSNNKRKRDDDPLLDPEEEEKRRMRRDRNRLAAAKCRKRRLDQIETLQVEVEGWERRNKKLEDEIAALRAEKENGIYPGGSQILLQTPGGCGQRGHGQGRASNHGGKPGNRICPGPSRGANTLGDLHPQASEASLFVIETSSWRTH